MNIPFDSATLSLKFCLNQNIINAYKNLSTRMFIPIFQKIIYCSFRAYHMPYTLYISSHLSLVNTSWGTLYRFHLTGEHLVLEVRWVSQECTSSKYTNPNHASQEPDVTTNNNQNRGFIKGIMAYPIMDD